ncbi:hypothetical protein IP92_04373 [Pseudoduganella flava]|uniref:DUF2970 domain-containing protein n=1 Tax=Pseudoduganella flava TaxID=871742 RepID=A0A562PJB7_9BURK|nr:hypothetical protein [Pseudoduganella flava]QGZ42008.1 hypothetical protein GO485_25125 [Pseudoduganella flava]TWI44423.1 hypothetical protein IP92_04373 [Pseudoduganella flava]
MNRMLWGWIIAAGLLLARLGYAELESADGGSPELTVLVLLTGGLVVGLFGITGLLGMLGWVPRPGQK